MSATPIQTRRLKLVPNTLEEVRAMVDAQTSAERASLSADWLHRLYTATSADLWSHGFSVKLRDGDVVVGAAAFKKPPTEDGVVEIAYGIHPEYQGRGFATEAAGALVDFAFGSGRVRLVCAHTLPGAEASKRVLAKCGFQFIGEVNDPEDGWVWRWEKRHDAD
jgi:RimJ/RimL family protein N-acetyltransferase